MHLEKFRQTHAKLTEELIYHSELNLEKFSGVCLTHE